MKSISRRATFTGSTLRPTHLNIFQRLTRQWDALHPYNAAQLIHLDGAPDGVRIGETWRSALGELGLLGAYPRAADTVHQTADGTDLATFLTNEMNRSFRTADASPFRPFILPLADGTHYLGVVYHHWIADSISIRMLLREWFLRIYDPAAARRSPLQIGSAGYWRLFGPDARRWDVCGGALDVFRWSSRLKRARRIESKSFPELTTRFSLHQLPDGLADRLLPIARAHDATLNDLFLAAMAVACDQYVAAPPNPKRPDLALGVIVDLRRAAKELQDTFGLYLGFTSVLCGEADLQNHEQLLRRIAAQSRQHKSDAVAESSMLRMAGGLMTGKILSPRKLLEFYRKRLPLAAGISNVNLNPTWVRRYHPSPILDYIRVSPTGPMLPLVFTPTTLGKRMHFGLTARESVVAPDKAGQAAEAFEKFLTTL